MRTMSADELRRHALSIGAEVVIDGRPFNTGKAQTKPRAMPPAPGPVAVAPATTTTAPAPLTLLVDIAKVIAEAEQRIEQRFAAAPAPRAAATEIPTIVVPRYKKDGQIDFIDVERRKRLPGEVVTGFSPKYRSDGAIESVQINYGAAR